MAAEARRTFVALLFEKRRVKVPRDIFGLRDWESDLVGSFSYVHLHLNTATRRRVIISDTGCQDNALATAPRMVRYQSEDFLQTPKKHLG